MNNPYAPVWIISVLKSIALLEIRVSFKNKLALYKAELITLVIYRSKYHCPQVLFGSCSYIWFTSNHFQTNSFNQSWFNLMELIKSRNAQLTALSAMMPKSISTLGSQVKKHEVMESELVSIQQQVSQYLLCAVNKYTMLSALKNKWHLTSLKVDDVIQEGQELLTALQGSKHHGGRRASKTESLVSERVQYLLAAWKEFNIKMADRRSRLNQCSRYLQFCEKVRFMFNHNQS